MIEYYKNLSLENLFYIDENGIIQEEEWRDIPNYEGYYQASNLGRIKSLKRNIVKKNGVIIPINKTKIKNQSKDKDGYLKTSISFNFKHNCCSVHRMVAITFIPNPENKPQVNHKDKSGTKWYNVIWNLEWNTASENVIHSVKNKLKIMPKGILSTSHKLTDEEVKLIREESAFINTTNLSKKYNVSRGLIYLIVNNKRRAVHN